MLPEFDPRSSSAAPRLAALLACALLAGCGETAQGLKEDAERNRVKAEAVAKDVGKDLEAGAEKAGETLKDAALEIGSEATAAGRKVAVKAALLAEEDLDATRIDLDVDDGSRILRI